MCTIPGVTLIFSIHYDEFCGIISQSGAQRLAMLLLPEADFRLKLKTSSLPPRQALWCGSTLTSLFMG